VESLLGTPPKCFIREKLSFFWEGEANNEFRAFLFCPKRFASDSDHKRFDFDSDPKRFDFDSENVVE
jgi:hypothetical protein